MALSHGSGSVPAVAGGFCFVPPRTTGAASRRGQRLLTEQVIQGGSCDVFYDGASHVMHACFPGIPWVSQMSPAQCGEGTARGPKCQAVSITGRPPQPDKSVFSGEARNPEFHLETVISLVVASSGAF